MESINAIVIEEKELIRKAIVSLVQSLFDGISVRDYPSMHNASVSRSLEQADLLIVHSIENENPRELNMCSRLIRAFRGLKVLVLCSGRTETQSYWSATGVHAIVRSDGPAHLLKDTIQNLFPSCTDQTSEILSLTKRETDVLVLICNGKSNKEIALVLNVVEKTVDYHKANIYRKTQTCNSAGVINYALKRKLFF